MSANVAPAPKAPAKTTPARTSERTELRKLPAGWRIIAGKEFADHVVSVRFVIVLLVLGLAAAIPLYFASDQIRNAAQAATTLPAVFLYLFTIGPENVEILRVDRFVGIVAPLLGLAFAFDAVNSERAEGTLPRLLSQPIYRDDVINGKFVAGLGVIGIVLVSVVLLIAGFGMFRLGIVPARPGSPAADRVGGRDLPVRGALAVVRAAAVGRHPPGGDGGARRLRRVAAADDLRTAHRRARVGVLHAGRERYTWTSSSAASRPRNGSRGSCRGRSTRRSRR